MSQLTYLRQKIKSIQTTRKITHAVRLISMSLYNRLDKTNTPFVYYTEHTAKAFFFLVNNAKDWNHNTLQPNDIFDKTPLYIIVSTSKGLCGGLNSNLFKYVQKSFFTESWQEPSFIVIGQKAITFVKELKVGKIIHTYQDLNSVNYTALSSDLIEKIFYAQTVYSSVIFYSNITQSFFTQKPCKTQIVPLKSTPPADKKDYNTINQYHTDNDFIWEQDKNDILHYAALSYLKTTIMNILFRALRAEHAARFLAMENSTTSADKYLSKLLLKFNKIRQGLITKEVAELAAGFQWR